MADKDQQQQQLRPNNREVKLPPFWPTNPAAWFVVVEGKFLLDLDSLQACKDGVWLVQEPL